MTRRAGRSTVVVTGAAGFVGSAVVRALASPPAGRRPTLPDGAPIEHVVGLVRPGSPAQRLAAVAPGPHWSIVPVDLARGDHVRALLEELRPSAIVHAALDEPALTDEGGEKPRMLPVLFESLGSLGGGRLIHTGSAWVLRPGTALAEGAPVEARSRYTRLKLAEDRLIPTLAERTGVEWINLRLFNLFGRYEQLSRLVPYLVARLAAGLPAEVSSGSQVRDFNDVDDAARAYAAALAAPREAAQALYHVGSGRATRVRDLVLQVASLVGDRRLVRFGAATTPDERIPELVADPARARAVLGWAPGADLEARLSRAVDWWLPLVQPNAQQDETMIEQGVSG